MWLAKPIYESIPYFYLIAGLSSIGVSTMLDNTGWSLGTFMIGVLCLIAGLVVWLRRRDSRRNTRISATDELR